MTGSVGTVEPETVESGDALVEGMVGQVAENFLRVVARVEATARRAGRDPAEITIVGAGKTVEPERIKAAIAAGLRHVGENYVQEALRKYEIIGDCVSWHFIGHLQSNKAKQAVRFCSLIHSLDRMSLAEELSKRALAVGKVVEVLVEVNLGYEESKSGVLPEGVLELIWEAAKLPGIRIRGLMTMPPYFPEPEQARPYFRRLRELAQQVERSAIEGVQMRYLSMGMSGDFEVAIEEGANIVRIGTAIFGPRP